LLLLLTGFFLFLAHRADTERYHWSYWGFGDAQTMLTLNQWEKGGWLHNYLLFKPQGWAPTVDLLDEPELRHHARGISPASSPRVGPRLWYTHYPAGYLVPYAALYRLGVSSLYGLQLYSIAISLAALVLMYLTFSAITDTLVALIAVLFYGGSTIFLGYADSLANQPLDDLLRFAFMLATIFSTRVAGAGRQRCWLAVAWGLEFCLSLSSFDSVFFLYTWLVGWDLLEHRGLRWWKWLLFALAPISAHSLQFLQNVWYLGWHDAGLDIVDAFMMKHSPGWLATAESAPPHRLTAVLFALLQVFYSIYSPSLVLLVPLALYAGYRRLFPGQQCAGLPSFPLLLLLFSCGLGYVLVLPLAATMAYEGRQMIPFVAMLIGGFSCSVIRTACHCWRQGHEGTRLGDRIWSRPYGYAFLGGVVLMMFWIGFVVTNRYPSPWAVGDDGVEELEFAQYLGRLATRTAPAFFVTGGLNFKSQDYPQGYPSVAPDTEYYAGSRTILCFANAELLANDLMTMLTLAKGEDSFSPVLISDRPEQIGAVVAVLEQRKWLREVPRGIDAVQGRFLLDLTPFLDWSQSIGRPTDAPPLPGS